MDFVSGVFAAWLLEQVADAGRNRLITFFLGSEQERAIRNLAARAVEQMAMSLCGGDEDRAENLAIVVDQVFSVSMTERLVGEYGTLLEALRAGIEAQLAPLGDAELTGTSQSSAEVLDVQVSEVVDSLASHLMREITSNGVRGGPLGPLAIQLGQDVTHLQGQRIEAKVDRLSELICEDLARQANSRDVLKIGQVVVGEIPREPPDFVSRETVDQLATAAVAGQVAVVCTVTGLRGVGKTQVAAAYARACIAGGWELVGWVNAETPDALLDGLARIAERLDVADPNGDSLESSWRLREHLNTWKGSGLLVFDNAVDADMLRPFLPATGSTQLIITSTDQGCTELGHALNVAEFSRADSLGFLTSRTALSDPTGADAVAGELGDLPLGLAQAAATIKGQRLTYASYLQRLREVPVTKLLGPVAGGGYPHSTGAALLVSIQTAEAGDSSGLASWVLRVLAVLSPSGVSRLLLDGLAFEAGGVVRVDAAVQGCVTQSLLTWSVESDVLIMHRLLGRVVRERDQAAGSWAATVSEALRLIERRQFSQTEAWARREEGAELAIHAEALWEADAGSVTSLDLRRRELRARSWAVSQLREAADHSRAIYLGIAVLDDHKAMLGTADQDTLACQLDLADAYRSAGRLEEAVALYEQTVSECEQSLGADHPLTLVSRCHLGYAYRSAGLVEEAIALLEYCLADHERVLGANHPDSLTTRSTLGSAYASAGSFEQAIAMHKQTLSGRQRVLGADHIDTFAARSNLAAALRSVGQHQQAIALDKQGLDDCKRVLGADHPMTLLVGNNLAADYHAAGQLDIAIPLYRQAAHDHEQVLGADHPETLVCWNNLAMAYKAGRLLEDAIKLLEINLGNFERVLGPGHPNTVAARRNLYSVRREAAAD